VLGREALRRFAKVEPFEFDTGEHLEAFFRGAREHFFSTCRGHSGDGLPLPSSKSARKNGTWSSHGTRR